MTHEEKQSWTFGFFVGFVTASCIYMAAQTLYTVVLGRVASLLEALGG